MDHLMRLLVGSLSLAVLFFSLAEPLCILRRIEIGTFIHAVEGEMLCASTMPSKVPYFNAPIYLPTKAAIGKVDEILGPISKFPSPYLFATEYAN